MVYKIPTPFLWFSQLIRGIPSPWKHFKIDGLMFNAYEIIQKKSVDGEIRRGGIHNYLDFEGPIAIDSGGFLFMKKEILHVQPKIIWKLYEESKPNYGVVLDHPIMPNLSNYEKRKRKLKTLENTRCMASLVKEGNPQLIPVIHGHSIRSIRWYIRQLNKIGDFDTYGIGSLVPSVFNSKGVGGIYNVVKIVSFVRRMLPDKKIHVFGIGSTLTMHLMYYVGADSVDSSGWRTKAAFGAIQLPETGDRYITSKKRHKNYPTLSRSEERLIENCKCPICKNDPFEALKNSFTNRALHNAWVYQQEVEKTRRFIKRNEYGKYVKRVLASSFFSKVLEYAHSIKIKV